MQIIFQISPSARPLRWICQANSKKLNLSIFSEVEIVRGPANKANGKLFFDKVHFCSISRVRTTMELRRFL